MPKFYAIFSDEQHMRKALNNLFTWLKFTFFIRNLDHWILKVVNDLQVSDNYQMFYWRRKSQLLSHKSVGGM